MEPQRCTLPVKVNCAAIRLRVAVFNRGVSAATLIKGDMMRELPILLNGEMVRATMARTKIMTRRPVGSQPELGKPWHSGAKWWVVDPDEMDLPIAFNPHGVPGDLLYARETFRIEADVAPDIWLIEYQADGAQLEKCYRPPTHKHYVAPILPDNTGKWRPSIHMPKWVARTWLRVMGVRVEQIESISEADCLTEGIISLTPPGFRYETDGRVFSSARLAFAALWDSIYDKRGHGWDSNCWVWVTEYEVMER